MIQTSTLLVILLAVIMVVFAAGPRIRVSTAAPPRVPGVPDIDQLEAYLAASEQDVPGLIAGTEKSIRWAVTAGQRTSVALVYLHGFSASRQDVVPLMDEISEALGANLFYARLTGHGCDGPALADARIADWQRDALEALAIGKLLGEQVVLVGSSTGGTIAVWLATQPEARGLAALVLLSPNFGPRDPMAELMLWPWGRLLVRLVVGSEYAWTPRNADHARYFTWRYPSEALLTMMAAVKLARLSEVERLDSPVLVLFSPEDRVVNARRIQHYFRRFGSEDKTLKPLEQTSDIQHHVLAGNILAPRDTQHVRDTMIAFLRPTLESVPLSTAD